MIKNIKDIEKILETITWIPIIFLSSLLIHNSILYFRFDNQYGIIPEKELALKDDLWIVCFYIHILAGMVCLLMPMINFIGRHFELSNKWHQIIGKVYVWNNLVFVAPTGMYIATYAKGGPWAEIGFIFQGGLLMYFSYKGYTFSQINIYEHIKFMIRSYFIALAVLTFRILHIVFMIMKVPYENNYDMSQWLSISLNLLMAEIIITYLTIKKKLNVPLLNYNI